MRLLIMIALLAVSTMHAADNRERLLANPASLATPANLSLVKAHYTTAFVGKVGESGFNLHSYLAYFDGRFWLCWSSAKVHEEDPDQHILYATSKDGHNWSTPRVLVADPDGAEGPQRWIARGMFVERGHLYALGALIASADYKMQGKGIVWRDLKLIRFRWTGKTWKRDSVFADDCMNNFPPMRVNGAYVMPCRDSKMSLKIARETNGKEGRWTTVPIHSDPPFNKMDEPTLYQASDGILQLIIRDGSHSGFLLRSVSSDSGRTWTAPVRTNYPDATSKNFATRLSDGSYILINNPSPKGRDPLAISLSKDGWSFDHPRALRASSQMPASSQKWSFQYPHAMEHDGSLWVAYSVNKRDIEVCEVKLSDLEESSH